MDAQNWREHHVRRHPAAATNEFTLKIDFCKRSIFEEGDVSVHIQPSLEPQALCYDLRDEDFRTIAVIDLVGFLPTSYGEEQGDNRLPDWRFVIQAMTVCAAHGDEPWNAWAALKNEPFF